MRAIEKQAWDAYCDIFGGEPMIVASAPGRVNLIGEHTDYNGGFVLPCAIDRRVAVALGRGNGELYSADYEECCTVAPEKAGSWADYPSGVVWALEEAGYHVNGIRAAFAGDVPQGSGLSSSAAIESATGLALDAAFRLGIPRKDLARLCQRAENGFVGVNSGIMDQYASLLCAEGACLLIDCRSLEARAVPLDLKRARLALLVCDTRVERTLGDTGYNERRAVCEQAARELGVKQLRDARVEDLDRLSGEELKRARHVVTENARVLEAAESLERNDFERFGALMFASHTSLRDDYAVSTRELDAFVELARGCGALGARLTGAGFGGCAIALIAQDRAAALQEEAKSVFSEHGYTVPVFYTFRPAAEAEVVARLWNGKAC